MEKVPVLIVMGSVGVGKSSVANAISEILLDKFIHHAVIDLDSLRHAFPRPAADWFHVTLGYKNLGCVWKNYKEVGVTCAVIPNVLEDRNDIKEIEKAIPGASVTVVRLKANLITIQTRLKGREKSIKSLEWHIKRAAELDEQLDNKQIEDFIVDTENKTIDEVAREILTKTSWPK